MKILVTVSKVDFDSRLQECVDAARAKVAGSSAEVVDGKDIDWKTVVSAETWAGVPSWIARNYDALVTCETERGGLGRGIGEMAKAMLAKNKPVGIVRDGAILPVLDIVPTGENDWKTYFYSAVV